MDNRWRLIVGIVFISISLFWIWEQIHLWYLYHHSNILFYYIIPNWVLLLNLIVGAGGVYIGTRIIQHSIQIKRGILIGIILIAISLLSNFLVML